MRITFEQLPKEYFKAYESFLKSSSKSYFRESLISNWIAIPASQNVVFKNFDQVYRIKKIIVPTTNKNEIEFQVHLNRNGIIGLNIGNDLESIIIENVDVSQFIIEKVPTSKFLTEQADLEYLDDFNEIDDYLDNKYSSEVFTINNVKYYSIIKLSEKNCIAINDEKVIYLLNKNSGLLKSLAKRPDEFVRAFKNDELKWLSET